MTKTEQNKSGVIGITSQARFLNPKIGMYQEHFINESFGFSVRLSNGAIAMSREIAQDYEVQPNGVTKERIQKVANTFRNI